MPLKIVSMKARDRDQIPVARSLFTEYAASLDFDLGFQDFDVELKELPGEYSPPSGRLLLVYQGEKIAGCVALRRLDDENCEMKRLFVKTEFRSKGIGRMLVEAIIKEAKNIGYSKMLLDTVPSMKAALALYRAFGFVDTSPYRRNPIPGALFLELDLRI